jgi:RNA polymerase sigma-70 factor (ECF subfamily)
MMRGRRSDTHTDGVSDEALLAGLAVGDEHAGIAFVRRYQRRVFGLAMSMVGDAGAAEDIAQEAFVRVWKHAAVFDPRRASVATWVLTITRNLAIDALRVRRGVPTDPDDQVWRELVSNEREPDDAMLTSDSVGRVQAALSELPVEQRRAVLLAAMYGRTAAEIASAESIPLGTAKSRIRMGIAKLREIVAIEEVS